MSADDEECQWKHTLIHTHIHTNTVPGQTVCNEIFIAVRAKVYTNQIILVWVEEVVQVVDRHHQVCLVDQAGGSHAVVSSRPLSICTDIVPVNTKISTCRCLVFENSEKGKNLDSSYDHLCKVTTQIGFNLFSIQSIQEEDFPLKSITETPVAWQICYMRFK